MKYRLTGSYAFKNGENNGFFVWIFSKWIIHFINLLQKQYWKLMSISTVRKMKNEIASGFMNLIPVLRPKIAIQHIFEARFTSSRFYILIFFYFRFFSWNYIFSENKQFLEYIEFEFSALYDSLVQTIFGVKIQISGKAQNVRNGESIDVNFENLNFRVFHRLSTQHRKCGKFK